MGVNVNLSGPACGPLANVTLNVPHPRPEPANEYTLYYFNIFQPATSSRIMAATTSEAFLLIPSTVIDSDTRFFFFCNRGMNVSKCWICYCYRPRLKTLEATCHVLISRYPRFLALFARIGRIRFTSDCSNVTWLTVRHAAFKSLFSASSHQFPKNFGFP